MQIVLVLTSICAPQLYRLNDCINRLGSPKFQIESPPANSLCQRYRTYYNNLSTPGIMFSSFVKARIKTQPKIVVHVRLGDVIEKAPQTATDFWEGNINQSSWRSTLYAKYVRPKKYYDQIFSHLNTHAPIHVHGSFCHNTDNTQKQTQYVNHLIEFLKLKGFYVKDRIGRHCESVTFREIDNEFIDMAAAFVFIPSGGGFSKLISSVVKNNGIVIR